MSRAATSPARDLHQEITDEELLRRIQSPYALPDYLDELRAERQRRASL